MKSTLLIAVIIDFAIPAQRERERGRVAVCVCEKVEKQSG